MSNSLAYEKRWRLDRLQGVVRSYVPITDVAPHFATLVGHGASATSIAKAAGVSPTTTARIVRFAQTGEDPRGGGIQRGIAERLLAVTLDDIRSRTDLDGRVPALGARRRVRALMALGWPHSELNARLECRQLSQTVLSHKGDMIARRTALAVERLYDALCTRPGPSEVTRARAVQMGYPSPLAWDDIDDPAAVPALDAISDSSPDEGADDTAAPDALIDEIAIARVLGGESLRLTVPERVLAVRALAARGLSDFQIAKRCRVVTETVQRDRQLHGIEPGVPAARPLNLRRTA